jgi:hypothetical protein
VVTQYALCYSSIAKANIILRKLTSRESTQAEDPWAAKNPSVLPSTSAMHAARCVGTVVCRCKAAPEPSWWRLQRLRESSDCHGRGPLSTKQKSSKAGRSLSLGANSREKVGVPRNACDDLTVSAYLFKESHLTMDRSRVHSYSSMSRLFRSRKKSYTGGKGNRDSRDG